MNKQLEAEMTRDLKEIDLTKAYETDLYTINRCINELNKVRDARTKKYEEDLRKI
jgi:hypothetical protein